MLAHIHQITVNLTVTMQSNRGVIPSGAVLLKIMNRGW